MNAEITVLLVTAASVGFIHTLTGPDHYLPFVVMGKARNWSTAKTLLITFLCGIGHVGSSIVIGITGIILGFGMRKLETLDAFRGNLAAWAFVTFGLVYFIWGIWKSQKVRNHKHVHSHSDGVLHIHAHHHSGDAIHHHGHSNSKPVQITPWILFTIFVLGPCEPLIPLLLYPAAEINAGVVVSVAAIFSFCTIATMMVIVFLALKGINLLPFSGLEKYMHAIAGATIFICGCAILFLGM